MLLAIITLVVYWQVGGHEFIHFDDDAYVTANPHVAGGISGKNIIWAFTTVDCIYWQPVTFLSHMADVQIYGMNPRGHHLTNVVLHTASALLLFLLLLRLTGALWQSLFVAALFALHPLHVESVAWVAERKDVLGALFWFLTLYCYSEYVAKLKPSLYILTLFFFVLGLMSKPMLVMLPIVMLLMDFWPLDRYRLDKEKPRQHQLLARLITLAKEKTLFFVCSLLSGIVTIYGQNKLGGMPGFNEISFWLRCENALIAYVKYIGKTVWPSDLAILYSFPLYIPLWQVIGSLLILLFITATAIWAGSRYPCVAVGWFWFLITLVPVIGLTQAGSQPMADRFTHIPGIGLSIMAGYGVPSLFNRLKFRQEVLALLFCLAITASALATWRQLGYWRDGISLFQHAVDVTRSPSDNHRTHFLLGNELALKGYTDAAIVEYKESLKLFYAFPVAHKNLAFALEKRGYLDEAIKEQEAVLAMDPNNAGVHNSLGFIYFQKGDLDKAIKKYTQALTLDPNIVEAHNNMGLALAAKGNIDTAIEEYKAALRLNPNYAYSHYNLGFALAGKGNLDAAIYEYQETLRITPNDLDAINNLALAVAAKSKLNKTVK